MNYDVIIVGGGVTGTCCALSLVQAGLKVAVIDQHPWDAEPPPAAKLRVSALTPSSLDSLAELGLESWLGDHSADVQAMQIWDGNGSGHIEFSSKLLGESRMGAICRNWVLLQQLRQQLLQSSAVTWFSNKPGGLTLSADQATLLLADGNELTAKLVVGAEGANSWVRSQVGIQPWRAAYGQTAIVAEFQTVKPHQQTAWQCFTEQGPLALLPLQPGHRVSIVWSVWEDQAKQLLELDDAEFSKACTGCAEAVLGKMALASQRLHFPLQRAHAPTYTANRVALIGDAIHSLHPLAGQGLNLGIADATALAKVLIAAAIQGADFGAHMCLRKFERSRKGANLSMLAAMESFHRLFTSKLPGVSLFRSLGMSGLNRLPAAKAMLLRQL